MSAIITYTAPRSLDEAAELLRTCDVTVLAGGTDLMPQSRSGRLRLRPTLMSVRNIPEVRGVTATDDVLSIGALTTITKLRDHEVIRSRLPALWQACDHFASDQIRNVGTIGGNICNASPAGDTLVPLLLHDARVVLASKPNGAVAARRLPLEEFLLGPGRTARADNELLLGVEVPLPPPGSAGSFLKLGMRPALDISTISIGFAAEHVGSRLHRVRIAFGAVAPRPIRARATEAALEDKPLDPGTIAAAAAAADAEIHPISDVRASDWYRREMVKNMLTRMLLDVRNR